MNTKSRQPIMTLLIDDQPMVAEAFNRIIHQEPDINIHYCAEACNAVATAEQVRPSVILLDLLMPQLDGIEIMRRLRDNEHTHDIPIVVLSSDENAERKVDAFYNGANDYLVKWPDRVELVARLRYHSDAYRAHIQRDEAYEALRISHRRLSESNLELARQATHDSLTQIANRRCFETSFSSEWSRAMREEQSLAIISCDVDYFKHYNDNYGHPAGDACLIQLTDAMQSALLRPSDLVARYGGEEFAILLPNTNCDGAKLVAQRIKENVTKLALPHEGLESESQVTLSMGIAAIQPQKKSKKETLLKQADQALYEAKRQGRNCFAVAP